MRRWMAGRRRGSICASIAARVSACSKRNGRAAFALDEVLPARALERVSTSSRCVRQAAPTGRGRSHRRPRGGEHVASGAIERFPGARSGTRSRGRRVGRAAAHCAAARARRADCRGQLPMRRSGRPRDCVPRSASRNSVPTSRSASGPGARVRAGAQPAATPGGASAGRCVATTNKGVAASSTAKKSSSAPMRCRPSGDPRRISHRVLAHDARSALRPSKPFRSLLRHVGIERSGDRMQVLRDRAGRVPRRARWRMQTAHTVRGRAPRRAR